MTGLSFHPVGGFWLVAAVALALAPLLALRPRQRKQSLGRRAALVALRTLTLALLLLAMLRPALETRTARKLPGTLIVLPDASRSMQVADAVGNKPRYEAMRQALAASQDQLAELAKTWTIRGYAFSRDVQPLKFADGQFELPEEPEGQQTAIGAALEEVLAREGQQRLVAVVLLSDGAQRAFAPRDVPPQSAVRRLAADGVPLYTFTFGQPSLGQQSDLRMSDMLANDAVFAETPAVVRGVVSAAGYANQQFKVQLLWETADGTMETVDTRTITVKPGTRTYPVELTHTPRVPGEYKVTLQVETPEGELVASNNSQSTFVSVLKGGVKILYLAGASRIGGTPGLEPRFIRAALAAHADLHVEYEAINYRTPELDYRDRLREEKFDVFLIGDVDSSGLSTRTWQEIARAVERGAGLAMLGGFHSFGPGGFANSPLEKVLPIRMSRTERQSFSEPPRDDMHLDGPLRMLPEVRNGQIHPIMKMAGGEANEALWRGLPPLDGANKFDRVQLNEATAQVWAIADNDARSPLLVLSGYGDGRAAALAVDTTWHWQLEGFGEVHRRFWRQLVLWLAKKDETAGQRVWVRLDQRRYQQASRVDFTLGADDPQGNPLPDADYAVHVEKPDGTTEAVQPSRRGQEAAGSFTATSAPGDYRVVVSARHNGQTVGEAAARFSVSDQDVELDQPAAEPMLLASLAKQTAEAGGAGLAPEELPGLLERLQERAAEFEEEVVEVVTLWDRWPTLLAFVGLLSAEWFLRKRWGLV
ncbi:MAG: hypothetical protein DCC67_16385 [Planctomycetota bacterium]|nr:MAG: hypothetical protein DCC67_16385 [Planctomycetota bacterium]